MGRREREGTRRRVAGVVEVEEKVVGSDGAKCARAKRYAKRKEMERVTFAESAVYAFNRYQRPDERTGAPDGTDITACECVCWRCRQARMSPEMPGSVVGGEAAVSGQGRCASCVRCCHWQVRSGIER